MRQVTFKPKRCNTHDPETRRGGKPRTQWTEQVMKKKWQDTGAWARTEEGTETPFQQG